MESCRPHSLPRYPDCALQLRQRSVNMHHEVPHCSPIEYSRLLDLLLSQKPGLGLTGLHTYKAAALMKEAGLHAWQAGQGVKSSHPSHARVIRCSLQHPRVPRVIPLRLALSVTQLLKVIPRQYCH